MNNQAKGSVSEHNVPALIYTTVVWNRMMLRVCALRPGKLHQGGKVGFDSGIKEVQISRCEEGPMEEHEQDILEIVRK